MPMLWRAFRAKYHHSARGGYMAQTVQISCINKTDRESAHERIRGFGGINVDGARWWLRLDDAIEGIKSDKWKFYVSVGNKSVWVIISKSAAGREYLKTEADGEQPNNLLRLPECP
jgi:Protein of unknown function (DUF3892)